MWPIIEPYYIELLRRAWNDGTDSVGVMVGDFDLENEHVQGVLELLAQRVTAIEETTRDEIRNEIGKMAREGLSIQDVRDRLLEMSQINSAYRAEMIARTESAQAYSAGSMAYYRETGVVGATEWLTTDPCPICAPLSGKVVELGQQFDGGFDHPPAHPNCRCAIAPILKELEPERSIDRIADLGGDVLIGEDLGNGQIINIPTNEQVAAARMHYEEALISYANAGLDRKALNGWPPPMRVINDPDSEFFGEARGSEFHLNMAGIQSMQAIYADAADSYRRGFTPDFAQEGPTDTIVHELGHFLDRRFTNADRKAWGKLFAEQGQVYENWPSAYASENQFEMWAESVTAIIRDKPGFSGVFRDEAIRLLAKIRKGK